MSLEIFGDEPWDAPITEDDVEQAFRDGAQACREMLARFVTQGGDTATAQSIRLNWCPSWGADPGRPDHVLLNYTGLTQDDLDRGRQRAAAAVASAIEARRAETGTGSVADESAGPSGRRPKHIGSE